MPKKKINEKIFCNEQGVVRANAVTLFAIYNAHKANLSDSFTHSQINALSSGGELSFELALKYYSLLRRYFNQKEIIDMTGFFRSSVTLTKVVEFLTCVERYLGDVGHLRDAFRNIVLNTAQAKVAYVPTILEHLRTLMSETDHAFVFDHALITDDFTAPFAAGTKANFDALVEALKAFAAIQPISKYAVGSASSSSSSSSSSSTAMPARARGCVDDDDEYESESEDGKLRKKRVHPGTRVSARSAAGGGAGGYDPRSAASAAEAAAAPSDRSEGSDDERGESSAKRARFSEISLSSSSSSSSSAPPLAFDFPAAIAAATAALRAEAASERAFLTERIERLEAAQQAATLAATEQVAAAQQAIAVATASTDRAAEEVRAVRAENRNLSEALERQSRELAAVTESSRSATAAATAATAAANARLRIPHATLEDRKLAELEEKLGALEARVETQLNRIAALERPQAPVAIPRDPLLGTMRTDFDALKAEVVRMVAELSGKVDLSTLNFLLQRMQTTQQLLVSSPSLLSPSASFAAGAGGGWGNGVSSSAYSSVGADQYNQMVRSHQQFQQAAAAAAYGQQAFAPQQAAAAAVAQVAASQLPRSAVLIGSPVATGARGAVPSPQPSPPPPTALSTLAGLAVSYPYSGSGLGTPAALFLASGGGSASTSSRRVTPPLALPVTGASAGGSSFSLLSPSSAGVASKGAGKNGDTPAVPPTDPRLDK